MYRKVYLSRSQTKASAIDYPVGDATGGAAYGEFNDPVSAAIGVGGSLLGGLISSNASQSAANTQAQTAANQIALQQQIFNTQNAQLAPQRAAGYNALNQIGSLLGGQYTTYDANGQPTGTATGTDYLTHQFNNQDLNAQLAPNYAFQLGQGQGATNAANNATGGSVSGNALKGLQDYTQNFAGNAYQQAFSNYQNQRQGIYNTLAGIAGLGQASQNASNTLASNYGTNVGNLATGSAAAQAAGQIGSASALSGGLTGAGNMYALSSLLNPTPTSTTNFLGTGSLGGGSSGGFGLNANSFGSNNIGYNSNQ